MTKPYHEVVQALEALQIMPKTMPGIEKVTAAMKQTTWYSKIDPSRVIVVAGTNGKGTTCAVLERLLIGAGQNVGFYSSPHLITTTERIRTGGHDISQAEFVKVYEKCFKLIQKFELTHFEALTLMAAEYFFDPQWDQNLDFAIFEVGLGGKFDATNAIPHKYCIITKIGFDHVNILGNSLTEIAQNKFGIIHNKNIVVHHPLPSEIQDLKKSFQKATNSNWIEAEVAEISVDKKSSIPRYFLNYSNQKFEFNIPGKRSAENIMSAISMFQILGFDSSEYLKVLNQVNWSGRMQKIIWPNMKCPLYLSGDHNEQGIESLIEILRDFNWRTLHIVIGIGVDKDAEMMLDKLRSLSSVRLYLTETPFKGRKLNEYPDAFIKCAYAQDVDVIKHLDMIASTAESGDVAIVTGSLYLVGEVLKKLSSTTSKLK